MKQLSVSLLCVSLLTACSSGNERDIYIELDTRDKALLPLAPHVAALYARPTPEMIQEHVRVPVRFMVLDKRTLRVQEIRVPVGEKRPGPWGGWLEVKAYVPDLLIRDRQAIHGPEGHVNPVVWVVLLNGVGSVMYEGWMFARDSSQMAWDHTRFDVTFVGIGSGGGGAAPAPVIPASVVPAVTVTVPVAPTPPVPSQPKAVPAPKKPVKPPEEPAFLEDLGQQPVRSPTPSIRW